MTEQDQSHEHWQGTKNKLIRYFFYCNRGLDTFNSFRYVLMAIFGIYYTLHLHQPVWLILMFVISIPILIITGYYSVHHVGKVIDWLNVKFSTHYGKYSIELQESVVSTLKDIREDLRTNNN